MASYSNKSQKSLADARSTSCVKKIQEYLYDERVDIRESAAQNPNLTEGMILDIIFNNWFCVALVAATHKKVTPDMLLKVYRDCHQIKFPDIKNSKSREDTMNRLQQALARHSLFPYEGWSEAMESEIKDLKESAMRHPMASTWNDPLYKLLREAKKSDSE